MDDASAEASHGLLVAGQEREGLTFSGRPLCNVLRPHFLTESDYSFVRRRVATVAGALVKVWHAYGVDGRVADALALTDLERRALEVPPGYSSPIPFGRMDAFFDHGSRTLRFVEFNGETPAGVGYEDILGQLFMDLPPVAELRRRRALRVVEGRDTILDTLLGLAREAGVQGPHGIAIVDWPDVPTRAEFEILARRFRERGVPTVLGAPDELRYSAGRLSLRDQAVTIVYKRVLVSELLERHGLDLAMIQALRDGAAVMANPFQCRPLHKKACFAVLSDERFAELFTAEELASIAAHVPWTRRLEDRRTVHDGHPIDLLPWVESHRERLVIKPNDDYGGRGVVLGWEVDAEAWGAALQGGLERPAVVQDRVATVPEMFPLWDGARLRIEPRLVDTDPYCYHGRSVHGVLTRLSAGGLLNVTAGAGSVAPTLIVGD